jgi:glutathione S-transferase
MENSLPAYSCRVQGDASSWRKVLTMAGFGNSGLPPTIAGNMEDLALAERKAAASQIKQEIWDQYAASRPCVADTPQGEAALIMTRNRDLILADTGKRGGDGLPESKEDLDATLRELIILLHNGQEECDSPHVGSLARFLDNRMCVPRDMGKMSAAAIKHLGYKLP